MLKLTKLQWRLFERLRRKHKVSKEFLQLNLHDIRNFVWYEIRPRIVIRHYAIRRGNRVFLEYYRLRRVLYDQNNRKLFQRKRLNIKQWSKRMVAYLRRWLGVQEYVVEEVISKKKKENTLDITNELKKQLELLKNGRRGPPLMELQKKSNEVKATDKNPILTETENRLGSVTKTVKTADKPFSVPNVSEQHNRKRQEWQNSLESTPEKQITAGSDFLISIQQTHKYCSSSDITDDSRQGEEVENNHLKTNGSFLDVLMSKVVGGVSDKTINSERSFTTLGSKESSCETLASLDSNDGFLGFDETERIPGMLMTPVVPQSNKNKSENSAFVSEMLNEYMRVNLLESDYKIEQNTNQSPFKKTDLEGLVTPKSVPPPLPMPAVPETLLKLRTVAERKQYLQKFSKNHRLSIINNEAAIYRELQRKIKTQKAKSTSQALFQSKSSPMSFSRNGWQAASFVNTEFNKYYYQMIDIDRGKDSVRLRGVQGNNESFRKKPYLSHVHNKEGESNECPQNCLDRTLYKNLKTIKTNVSKNTKKLNQDPLKAILKPCPLLFKPFQKPLDDDTAALLLSGGSMTVVQMPLIELEVFPEQGKPLHEVAKRYLQYILPHHDISREWAEFSVSALQTPTTILQQVEEQITKTSALRKSFTFIIPYNNDRSQILVRRVVDRSEKLDQLFEQKHDISETSMKDFTFRRNLYMNATASMPDAIAMDCADILSDMINTVAISCSENSFIKEDPHGMYDDADSLDDVQIQSNQHKTSTLESYGLPSAANNKKQNRLLMELKRLNATIIDAAVKKDNETRSCNKEYCSLGCVCSSLESGHPLRDHCGKAKCVLECTCKSSNQSRIMRLETDGRCITTEDAVMLRRKATARLARMEKEFTSTVVLTGNETLLINETNNDKKRRCTKTPKRYEDLGDTDRDDESNQRITPKKTNPFATMDNNTEHCVAIGVEEWEEPVFVKDTVLEQLRHCTVNLTRLEETDNMVTWCMVHELYKCFCKGRALEGKPFIVEKEETNVTTVHSDEKKEDNLSKENGEIKVVDNKTTRPSRNYSFEKTEKRRKIETIDLKNMDIDDEAVEQSNNNNKNVLEQETRELNNTPDSILSTTGRKRTNTESDTSIASTKRKCSIEEVKQRYYIGKPEWCRRQVPIPRRMYMHTNRNRRRQVLNFIKSNENPETRLLLNEHIMRSVYYHQAPEQGDKTRRISEETAKQNLNTNDENEQKTEKLLQKLFNIPQANLTLPNKSNERDLEEVIELIHDDDDDKNVQEKPKKPNITIECSKSDESLAVDNQATTSSVINFKKFASLSGESFSSSRTTRTTPNQLNKDGNSAEKNEFPKISSPFSLNLNPTTALLNENSMSETGGGGGGGGQQQHNHQSKKASSNIAAVHKTMLILAKELKMSNEDFQALYNDIICCMNGMVCKKMYEVSEAFKRDNITIPQPRPGILCIMRWSNFLAAFMQHCLFMWQVKMKDEETLLLVTINNMMPLVVDALGVVNIMALKIDKLPLMARMLLTHFQNEETHNLGVIMQGKATYWLVKGFIRGEAKHACFKPNPQTRPQLTKKINILCSLLVEQRVREEKLRMLKKIGNSSTNSSTTSTPTNVSETNNNNNSNNNSASQIGQQTVNNESVSKANNNKNGKESDAVSTSRKKTNLDSSFACINNVNSTTAMATADVCNKNTEGGGEVTFKVRSNIELRKIQQSDVEELHLPECHKYDHKWLVLDLHDDFSHIFVPEFKELLSLDRIHKVMAFAEQKQKIIKMQFFNSAPFDVFVTPKSAKKVYVGPLKLTAKQPLLILLQSVDGQMMMRELYQQKHNVNNKMKPTKAFWLLSINGQMHLEVDINDSRINEMMQQRQTKPTTTNIQQQNKEEKPLSLHMKKANDDEDCFIIENNSIPTNAESKSPEVGTKSQSKERYNFTIETVNNDTLQITPQSITLPPSMYVPTNVSPYTLQHLSAINTTIKPINTIANSAASPCAVTTYVKSGGSMEVVKRENNKNVKRAIRLTSESGLAPTQPPPPLIAPTTTSSVLITKVVSLNSTRNSLLLNKTNPPSLTMSITNPILSSTEPIITNATSTMAGTPIISSVYSVSANPSKGSTTKTNTINSHVKNPITRRRFSTICPSNKSITSTTNTTKTTVREKFLMSNPSTQLREVVVGGEKVHPSTKLREVIVGGCGGGGNGGNVVQTPPVHTIGCTTITKLTDTTMMVVANTNAIKSLRSASVSSDASLLKTTKTTPTTTSHDKHDETIIRDLQMKCYPIASPVNPSRPINVKTVTTTTTTSCNNVKVLYKKPSIANAPTTTTTTTNTVVSGTLVQLDKLQAAKLNTKISNITPNPNNPIVLNKWATPTPLPPPPPLNDNNNTLQFRIINKNQNATSTANSSNTDGNNKLLQYNISPPSTSTTNAAASDESLCVENEIHSNVILKQATDNPTLIPITASITTITKAISASLITINSNLSKLPKRLLMKPSAKNKNTPTDTMSIKTSNCKTTTISTLPTVMPKSTTTTTKAIQNAAEFLLNTSSSSTTSTKTNTTTTPPNTSKQCTKEDNVGNNSPPSYIQYGYVVTPNIDKRFVAKRVKSHYFLKFPNDGIRRFEKMHSVSNYLNKYLAKDNDCNHKLPAVWKFLPASQSIQIQNYKKSLNRNVGSSDAHAHATATATATATSTVPANLMYPMGNKILTHANSSTSSSGPSLLRNNTISVTDINETILIED